ncbi:MAG: glutamate synthase large subunit [Myxococcaceae bacterium]|nr:glutamate synthase large subunit [Myxococcaceae bacterium]
MTTLYDPSFEKDSCGMGFVAHLRGEKSRAIIEQALEVLYRLKHRAATGADPLTGDGAGILLQLPHRFFKREGLALGFEMPRRRCYGIAQVFLPRERLAREACERILEAVVKEQGQSLIGWRDVPVDASKCGPLAASVLPVMRQLYIGRRRMVPSAFERKLFVIRKLAENRVRETNADPTGRFHIASCSAETIVYKGLLLPEQLSQFYADLTAPDMVSGIALVHSRFSTNTFPTWDLAQPFRFIAHNGEINTVQGNRNWMHSRRGLLHSSKFGVPLEALHPIIVPGKSDSAQFDNMLELLVLSGRSLPHAMMMMIPEAWDGNVDMDDARAAFYEFNASLMEPWDGPAAIAFCDGNLVGATLDRNGLRPARYLVTHDDRVILASEAGVLDVPDELVKRRGRLQPGRMFLVDTIEGRIVEDAEVKDEIARRWPYRKWLDRNVFTFEELPEVAPPPAPEGDALARLTRAFGYTDEDLEVLLPPMAREGHEAMGSMGQDAPLAVLSDRAPSLFDYFHQLFAQVTNPPIDPLREKLVMSLATSIGPDGNTLEETPEQCHRLALPGPILTNEETARVKAMHDLGVFEPRTLSCLYGVADSLEAAVEKLCDAAVEAVEHGADLLILSDRGVDAGKLPIPALLALSAVHQRLVRDGIRRHTGLLVETGEAREVHHFALLIGYGAAAVNPYLALDALPDVVDAAKNFVSAVNEGLLKVMSKMGISTVQSYRGAQIFEAVGLDKALVDRHFSGTPSRLAGVGLTELDREVRERHARGFEEDDLALPVTGGVYQWRRRGEQHFWNPATVAKLQASTRANSVEQFREYERLADEEGRAPGLLRGLLELKLDAVPVPLAEVEPASSLVRRFVSGAMSFGSISAEAHETLAIAMNRLGARSNSGEGGEEPRRYVRDANGDSRRSAIKQVASARFGVTTRYLVEADELQIKMAQGAKPGEGGQLPGHKVDARIAKVRWSTPGVTLISPPPHHDIYSIEDLAELIYDLQAVNPSARVSVKLVAEAGVGTVAAGVAKAGAGGVTVSGYEGGTGASPLSSIKHAGLPWELGLAEAQQVLVMNGLRDRIRLQVDGGLRTSRDVIIAALLGADEFGMATASLVAQGCVMLRKCHLNTCSVGIATQDPRLREHFKGTPEDVVSFFMLIAEGVREWLAKLGARTLEEVVGRVERLAVRSDVTHWKASRLDVSAVIAPPVGQGARSCRVAQKTDVSSHFDLALGRPSTSTGSDARCDAGASPLVSGRPLIIETLVSNTHRAVGAMLSGERVRKKVTEPLHVRLSGAAGQSFGAFLSAGVTLELEGEANDYVGKGLSGGRIVVYPSPYGRLTAEENVIAGNTLLYGATEGDAYFAGVVGERFCVRNSGATAVVEGVGDHACEYMTGGTVLVLGPTGRNFAAGMSGGVAYVLNRSGAFAAHCNTAMVELEGLEEREDIELVRELLERHVRLTRSVLGRRLLDEWEKTRGAFVKVMPRDYKQALLAKLRVVGSAA